MQLNFNIIMDYFYIFLIVIYFILSLMNVSGAGPEFARKRQEEKEANDWVNAQRDDKDKNKPEFVSAEYYYYTLLTFALIPFHTLTKDNRFYIVRLVGYLTDILYGGIGLVIWMIIYLTKNILDALCDVFFKIKDL